MKKAVYPGSFDPITYGHLDLIGRGARIFDELIVSVAAVSPKSHLFSVDERVAMVKALVKHLPNVTVDTFEGLTIDHLRRHRTNIILRGIRTVSDFEYEFEMAVTNRTIDPKIETVLVMSDDRYAFIRSSHIKAVAELGGPLTNMVPPLVEEALRRKLGRVK
jgi:pantetheine-phosphate adenylyltransferase